MEVTDQQTIDAQGVESAPAQPALQYRCPTHLETSLAPVLRGGAGFCALCRVYVQALGIPEPVRDILRPDRAKKARAKKAKKAKKKVARARSIRRGASSPALLKQGKARKEGAA